MRSILLITILLAVVYTGTLTSCKKKGDTKAIVTVIDTLGLPVAKAKVILWQDTVRNVVNNQRSNVRVEGTTDGSGKATFTFENEAFLNIDAVRTDTDSSLAHMGHSFVRLQQYETVETTVTIPW
jgi:hypothetical protein